jgi:hypothetical protein
LVFFEVGRDGAEISGQPKANARQHYGKVLNAGPRRNSDLSPELANNLCGKMSLTSAVD